MYNQSHHSKAEEVWRRYQSTEKRRPRKLDERAERLVTRKVMQKPFRTRAELQRDLQAADADVSQDTIGRALDRVGIHSHSPRKTLLLKTRYVNARLKFAREHLEKPADFWDKILWSDETKLVLFGGKKGTAYDTKNTTPTIKHGGGSILLWKELKIKVHERNPQDLCELKTICQVEWEKIDSDFCKKRTSNCCKRLTAVFANNGHATKY